MSMSERTPFGAPVGCERFHQVPGRLFALLVAANGRNGVECRERARRAIGAGVAVSGMRSDFDSHVGSLDVDV